MHTMRTIVLAALSLSFLLPGAALAGHPEPDDRDPPPRYDERNHRGGEGRYAADQGFVTVTNENLTALEVLVDRQVVGTVAPQQTARFGPFERGTHRVKVRYACDGLTFPVARERVEIDPRRPARIIAPFIDAGLVTLDNAWVEPMVVRLNGRVVAQIPAGGKKMVKLGGARGTLQLITPQGAVAASRAIRLGGLERASLALIPPSEGAVTIFNPSASHSLDVLCARGRLLATVPPSSARRLNQPAGRVTLTASYRGHGVQTATVLASPYDRTRWDIELPDHATLSVRNPNAFPVDVYAAGQLLGQVQGRDVGQFAGVHAGWTELQVSSGRRNASFVSVTVDVDPLSGGLLTVPRIWTSDGRGATASCDRDAGRSAGGYEAGRAERRYASSRRW